MVFSGKATYDQTNEIGESVSDLVSMISPFETTLLDRLGDAAMPATNIAHEWLENSLGPGTLTASTAINSATAATTIAIDGSQLQIGDLLRYVGASSLSHEEYLEVTAAAATSITVSRGVDAVGPASSAAGASVELISSSALEGADMNPDISTNRTRITNYTQIFTKPLEVSGSRRAVDNLGDIGDEMASQARDRLREALRDLERALMKNVGASTVGGNANRRRTAGLRGRITTNVASIATLDSSWINNIVVKAAWDNGARDLDILVAGGTWKDEIDAFAESRINQGQDEDRFRKVINRYESSFGLLDVLPANPWLDGQELYVLASGRVMVKNLQGRSFFRKPISATGDADKEQLIGEYVTEIRNESGHSRAYRTA